MELFINLIIILFFMLTFTVSFFSIDKFKKSDFAVKRNFHKSIVDFLEGSFYSSIAVLFQLWLYQTNQPFMPYLFIAIGITIAFLRGAIIGSYAVFGITLYTMFFFSIYPDDFYHILTMTFLTMIVASVARNFFDFHKSIIITFSFMIVNVLIFWIFSLFIFHNRFDVKLILATMVPFIISTILISVISYLVLFFKSANILYESSTYDYGGFYRESYANFIVSQHILERKIQYAFFVVLDIKWNTSNAKLQKQLEKKLLDKAEEIIPSSAILFKVNKLNYGFIWEIRKKINISNMIKNNNMIKRPDHDPLSSIEHIVNKLNGFYSNKDNKGATAKVYAGVTIYGLQEDSMNGMRKNAEFALQTTEWHDTWSPVSLFDPKIWRKNIKDATDITFLRQKADISFIAHEYIPMINLKTGKTVFNVSNPTIAEGGEVSFNAIVKYATEIDKKDLLNRYTTARAVIGAKNFKESKIVIHYSSTTISSKEFSTDEFISRVKRFSQIPANIIVVFYSKEYSKVKDNKIFIQNIKKLKQNGITIGLDKCSSLWEIKDLNWINPEIVLMKSINLSAFKINEIADYCNENKIILAAPSITTDEELSKVLKTKIRIIGGPLFNRKELYPTVFNKKSKIYVDTIKNKET